jgi:hypothetical protein
VVLSSKRTAAWIAISLGVLLGLIITPGFIGLRYPRAKYNNPLRNPVQVDRVHGRTLVLADGRELELSESSGDIAALVAESKNRIDLVAVNDQYMVFVNRRGWICGTPFAAMIQIPLIPVDVPMNRREPIGVATLLGR